MRGADVPRALMEVFMKKGRFNLDMAEGMAFVVAGGALLWYSSGLSGVLGLTMSPGLFPGLASVFLILLGIALAIRGAGKSKDTGEVGFKADWLTIILVAIISMTYVILMPITHFIWTTAAYLVSFLLIIGERKPITIALVSVASPWAIYLVFGVLLKVSLP